MSDLRVRDAVASDRGALNALTHASSAYKGDYAAILDGYEISAEQMERDAFRVAERAGAIVGYYSLTLQPEPELDLMFVADSEQGAGLGALLFEDLLAAARTRGIAEVKIVSNPPAAPFYRRMGASVVGIEPPRGRVTWERPILRIATGGSRT